MGKERRIPPYAVNEGGGFEHTTNIKHPSVCSFSNKDFKEEMWRVFKELKKINRKE